MSRTLEAVRPESVIVGWDFSTSAVKCLAFDLDGNVLAEVRIPTDLREELEKPPETQELKLAPGQDEPRTAIELGLTQLEGQARSTARAVAGQLREQGRLGDWTAAGISATHHTAGRIDACAAQVRRAICWNDQTLAWYHAIGLARLGGEEAVEKLLGGPWAVRYSLSHLVKDEFTLDRDDWRRTERILPHGPLAAGYLTGNFRVTSVSSAASTGIMNLESDTWCREMLAAIADPELRELASKQLPAIVAYDEPVGPLSPQLAAECGIPAESAPLVFPTNDDQQAGLVGGGAVDDGQMAIVLGTSAVVNSSSQRLPDAPQPGRHGDLDVMKLNWGPYLWMRCYTNGAKFVETLIEDVAPRTAGGELDWARLEAAARDCPAGADGAQVLPFLFSEPSLGVKEPRVQWLTGEPGSLGERYRAALEAVGYLIALGVRAHRDAGQRIDRVTVSGGLARSDTMCRILATLLKMPIQRLESDEGPALGAAVTALAALESRAQREQGAAPSYGVADAVARMVKFRDEVAPVPEWAMVYEEGLRDFEQAL